MSAPTTVGFNLVAWITPFVIVGAGGLIVGITLLRWRGRRRAAPAAPVEAPHPPSASPYEKILEKELKNFES